MGTAAPTLARMTTLPRREHKDGMPGRNDCVVERVVALSGLKHGCESRWGHTTVWVQGSPENTAERDLHATDD